MTRPKTILLFLALLLGAAACGPSYIENTDIPETDETRAIYDVVMEYRRAMEDRDVDTILSLVSRRYYENAATTERDTDDYGYETLAERVVPTLKENVKAVQYRILMRRIGVDGERAWADYEYFYHFKYVEGGVEGWSTKNDFNRLDFVKEDGHWRIAGGL